MGTFTEWMARLLEEDLPAGTPVTVTHGVYRGRSGTTGKQSWFSYLVTVKMDEGPDQVEWIPRSHFTVKAQQKSI
jgi:hypothetical protein